MKRCLRIPTGFGDSTPPGGPFSQLGKGPRTIEMVIPPPPAEDGMTGLRGKEKPLHNLVRQSRQQISAHRKKFSAAAGEDVSYRMFGTVQNRLGNDFRGIYRRKILRIALQIAGGMIGVRGVNGGGLDERH